MALDDARGDVHRRLFLHGALWHYFFVLVVGLVFRRELGRDHRMIAWPGGKRGNDYG
jgi:hypothetical protein